MSFLAELWLSLEEHQYALELIMGRYRKQMLQLMMAKKELDTKPVLSLHENHAKVKEMKVYLFDCVFKKKCCDNIAHCVDL